LPLGTLRDLGRSKSEHTAENVLLRQQLVLLARFVRTWKQTHITRSTRHTVVLALWAFPPGLEAQVSGRFSSVEGCVGYLDYPSKIRSLLEYDLSQLFYLSLADDAVW